MKPLVSLFYVVIVAAYFGCALGNDEDDKGRNCPLEGSRHFETDTFQELMTRLATCMNQTNTDLTQIRTMEGIENFRGFFKKLCIGLPVTIECLSAESTKWNSCYNTTMSKIFTVFHDLVHTTFQKGCENEGEILATIFDGLDRYTEDFRSRNNFVRECIINVSRRLTMLTRSEASIPTKLWFLHREIEMYNECSVENIPEESLVRGFVELINEVVDKMKCLQIDDESLVLCKSIDDSSIDRTSVCPLKTKSKLKGALGMILDHRMYSCFYVYDPYGQQLSNTSTIEEYRSYFENYCRRNARVKHCLDETTIAASMCLHDAQYKNFKLIRHYLSSALEAGCFEKGKRLANMFHAANMLKNNTEQRDVLVKCLSDTHSTRNLTLEDSTMLYRFYRELPVVRQCMVEEMRGDDEFVGDLNAFVDEMMSKMLCINTKDGSVVLCQTLET